MIVHPLGHRDLLAKVLLADLDNCHFTTRFRGSAQHGVGSDLHMFEAVARQKVSSKWMRILSRSSE